MQQAKDNQKLLFGERIASERKRLGLKQQEAATRCEVSRVMWGRYERNEAIPGMEVMERFAAIGAKPGVLLGMEAPDSWDPGVAEWLLIDEIAAQLGLHGGHVDRLEAIERQLREDRRNDWKEPDQRHQVVRGSTMMRAWLSESPYFLGGRFVTLEEVIELLEFVLSVAGKTMRPGDKAAAIVMLLKKAKSAADADSRAGERELRSAVKELVDKLSE